MVTDTRRETLRRKCFSSVSGRLTPRELTSRVHGWLPMAAVQRVEIIRGPLSALYGSEALGGVINLITKKPKDRWMASIGLSGATGLDSDTVQQ